MDDATKNMRVLRYRAGLTQDELAERVGLTPRQLRRIELAQSRPRPGAAKAIADVLETTPDALFPEERAA